MQTRETLSDFYQHHAPENLRLRYAEQVPGEQGHFNVYLRSEFTCKHHMAANRRDFYKISFIKGTGKLHYADKGVEINAPALLFSNPNTPYSWEATSVDQTGYFCVFTERFVLGDRSSKGLADSPLFKKDGTPVFFLSGAQQDFLGSIYEKMLLEINSDYLHKYQLLNSYVHLIMHEALKMQPNQRYFRHYSNASERITHLFTRLLEQQFPIDSPVHQLSVKTPAQFAAHLSVHVNHLNRAVKETTGQTTSELISGRIAKEAKALLEHTHWNIAEIAWCLGFAEPAYFTTFFRKHHGVAPGEFRKALV